MKPHPYAHFFYPDLPPAFGGSILLYFVAVIGMIGVVAGVSSVLYDAWRDLREDPNPKGDPCTIWRKIVIWLMVGTFMRSFPIMIQNLCRPELSDVMRMRWTAATYLFTSFSFVPLLFAMYHYFMAKKVITIQLKKQPIEIDTRPRWKRIRKLVAVVCLVVIIGTCATLQVSYTSAQEAAPVAGAS